MTSDRKTLLAEAHASAKRSLSLMGGCVDTPVDLVTGGNADGVRRLSGMVSPREAIIRNGLPPVLVDDPL